MLQILYKLRNVCRIESLWNIVDFDIDQDHIGETDEYVRYQYDDICNVWKDDGVNIIRNLEISNTEIVEGIGNLREGNVPGHHALTLEMS